MPPLRFTRIGEGQSNLTYRLVDTNGTAVVLRRPPLGEILASAHDMSREHMVLSALAEAGAPVPRTLAFCGDTDICGAPFYVMEHVDGLVVSSVAVAETLDVGARTSLGLELAGTLAALHGFDVDAVGLTTLRRPESLAERQLRRWTRQWHASKTRELPLIDEISELLAAADAGRDASSPSSTATTTSATCSPAVTGACGRCSTGSSARSATRLRTSG